MTLGQKIREARLSQQMTQQDVVGDFITRNMLSKIENDCATPSVKTLEYLAAALGQPPGAFLSGYEAAPVLSAGDGSSEELDPACADFPERLQREKEDWRRRGQELLLLEAEYELSRENLSAAEVLLGSAAPEAPAQLFRYCLLKGRLLLSLGRDKEAVETMEAAPDMEHPGRCEMDGLLETGYCRLKDFEKAYRYARGRSV